MKKVIISTLTVVALVTGSFLAPHINAEASTVENTQGIQNFKDVPATHWASSSIATAVQNGYLKGYADGTFKPNASITKAEMATILGRLGDQPNVASGTAAFTDVPEWAKEGVHAAVEEGFIDPSKYAGKLNANAALTRGEMATWFAQGLAAVNPDYKTALSDVTNTVIPAKEYFTDSMPAAQRNAIAVVMGTGLMSVSSDKTFGVDRTTTRAEVATLIDRYLSVAKKQPIEFIGLEELRAVGLTGTNLKVIAPSYVKIPQSKLPASYDYSKYTDDFSKIRNKELVTVTNFATIRVNNWIVINPYASGNQRSIYFPVFVDEGTEVLNGAYLSFAEFDLNVNGSSLSQVQAGSLINSPTINPLKSPNSKAAKDYSIPRTSDITKARGEFTVKNPHYWGIGLLHFDQSLHRSVDLTATNGTIYYVRSE